MQIVSALDTATSDLSTQYEHTLATVQPTLRGISATWKHGQTRVNLPLPLFEPAQEIIKGFNVELFVPVIARLFEQIEVGKVAWLLKVEVTELFVEVGMYPDQREADVASALISVCH